MCKKDEYNRKLLQITKKLKEVSEATGVQGIQGSPRGYGQEQDAMLSRKPYGFAACASCEKDLVNMQGHRADHHNWNKLPFRDPAERIAKFGNGFSHRLSMITSKVGKYDAKTSHRHSRHNKSIDNMPLK